MTTHPHTLTCISMKVPERTVEDRDNRASAANIGDHYLTHVLALKVLKDLRSGEDGE